MNKYMHTQMYNTYAYIKPIFKNKKSILKKKQPLYAYLLKYLQEKYKKKYTYM